ncbi:GGDEF domain-containing protein [Natronospora cellulosivora (SeqCode)]
MKLYNLFIHEIKVLERTRDVLTNKGKDCQQWRKEYEYLAGEYRKFLDEMDVIFSISDNNHKLIKEIQQRLEKEIVERQQTEEQLEEKIQQLFQYKERLEGANKKLIKLSSHDELTGLPNRRRFEEFIKELKQNPNLSKQPVSIIMIDIDFFKNYNDHYGHIAGDSCLKQVAKILTKLPRSTDFVARYGGEEFIVVLPTLEYTVAAAVAERIRTNIEISNIPHKRSRVSEYITVSLGVTTVTDIRNFTVNEIINSADKMLYKAKDGGRNQVKAINLGS